MSDAAPDAVEVRRLVSGEGEMFRDLRLRALQDAPYAFASSYALECDRPLERWEEIAAESEAGEAGVVFVATAGTPFVGMAGGYLHREDPDLAGVWGTWVAPEARGRGIGERLVEPVVEWARVRGMSRVELSVTERAVAANTLYRRLGFTATGVMSPLPSDPSIAEMWMIRRL
jgi:GNAT superfamily N-acetyltransferase